MKKKWIATITVLLLAMAGFAEAWKLNPIGYYDAEYLGTTKEVNVESALNAYRREHGNRNQGIIRKLSKQESALVNAALSNYDTRKGEVYKVAVQENIITAHVLRMIVVITGDKSYEYQGDYWY